MNLNPKEIFGGLRDATQGMRLSLVEIIALLTALVFAGVVTFYYFTKVQPLQTQLDSLKEREKAAKQQAEKKQPALLARPVNQPQVQTMRHDIQELIRVNKNLIQEQRTLQQQHEQLKSLNTTVASAMGACACWGQDAACPDCVWNDYWRICFYDCWGKMAE